MDAFTAVLWVLRLGFVLCLYLFLLAFGYSLPLWVQSVWVELHHGEHPLTDGSWSGAIVRAVACGAAFAAILVLRSRTSLDFIYFQF